MEILKMGNFCIKCKQEKSPNEFYKRKNNKPLSYCKDCQNELKEQKYLERIEFIIEMNCYECADCHIQYPAPVFGFIKDGKVFSLIKAKHMSFERLTEELKDHEMLCQNCIALRGWLDHSLI
jgi:hypothetical protein